MQQVTSVDRGWAWVVLVTVFLSNVLSCVNYMCGLFAIHFANTFNQPASVIAITGALANGTFCFSGPLASLLLKAVGARRGIFISTTVTVIGYIISAFCTSFIGLCICFGVLCGMSLGVTFIISMIPLGFYFDRYRNLAYGITSSGVGIGIMVLAPITSALIEHYTWRGTCIVFAAMLLHYYAFALIVDPITYTAEVERRSSAEDKSRLEANKVMVYDKQNGTLDGNQSLRNTVLKQQLYNKDSHSSYHSLQDLDTKEKQKTSKMHCEGKCVLQSNKELSFSDRDVGSRSFNKNKNHLYDDVMLHMSTDFISRSYVSLNAQEPSDTHGINNKINDASKDVSNDNPTTWGAFKNAFMIFTNIKYDLFCLNIILISAAIATIYNHLPAYSIAMGCTETNVSFLISVIGVSNISIRLLTGLITSTKCNSMIFYLGLLSLLSVLFLLAPMYGQYYIGQIFVAIVAGACNASIVLMSPFVIQFVGLGSLDVGFGFIMFMAGIGFLLGPPASGYFYDITGTFSSIFYFCAISLILATLVMLPIPILAKREYKSVVTQEVT